MKRAECLVIREWLAATRTGIALFWGVPTFAFCRSEDDRRLLRADWRTRRRLALLQKVPVWLLMTPALAVFFATRSKLVLLGGLLFMGLVYVPVVGIISYYFTYRLGRFEVHLRQAYSDDPTWTWRRG